MYILNSKLASCCYSLLDRKKKNQDNQEGNSIPVKSKTKERKATLEGARDNGDRKKESHRKKTLDS